jgi:acetyl esterase/lipase
MQKFWEDVTYSTQSSSQKLDIYLPSKMQGPYPVILWLHPGGFTGGDKSMIDMNLDSILGRGYAAVSVNYRLADEAHFPAQIYDAKAAVRWIRANAKIYNFNPEKISAWGVSAGSTIAALLGTTANVKNMEDLSLGNQNESCKVNAVVSLMGPMDFSNVDPQLTNLGLKLLGENVSTFYDRCKAINPMTYITIDSPPFYLQHGKADQVVPCSQSINFAKVLSAAIGEDKVALNLIEGADHFDPIHYSPENANRALDFLDRW